MKILLSGGSYILEIQLAVLCAVVFVGWLVMQTLRALEMLAAERNERLRRSAAARAPFVGSDGPEGGSSPSESETVLDSNTACEQP